MAALAMPALKLSLAPTQIDRAIPKKETGGRTAMRCAFTTERRLSRSGALRPVASRTRRMATEAKRIDSETVRKAEGGRRAASSPASAKMARKLKIIAAKTATAGPEA